MRTATQTRKTLPKGTWKVDPVHRNDPDGTDYWLVVRDADAGARARHEQLGSEHPSDAVTEQLAGLADGEEAA